MVGVSVCHKNAYGGIDDAAPSRWLQLHRLFPSCDGVPEALACSAKGSATKPRGSSAVGVVAPNMAACVRTAACRARVRPGSTAAWSIRGRRALLAGFASRSLSVVVSAYCAETSGARAWRSPSRRRAAENAQPDPPDLVERLVDVAVCSRLNSTTSTAFQMMWFQQMGKPERLRAHRPRADLRRRHIAARTDPEGGQPPGPIPGE